MNTAVTWMAKWDSIYLTTVVVVMIIIMMSRLLLPPTRTCHLQLTGTLSCIRANPNTCSTPKTPPKMAQIQNSNPPVWLMLLI
jgi:hypothetical protein